MLRCQLRFFFANLFRRRLSFALRGLMCLALGLYCGLCLGSFFSCLNSRTVRGLFGGKMRRILSGAPRFFLRAFRFLLCMLSRHASFFRGFFRGLLGSCF